MDDIAPTPIQTSFSGTTISTVYSENASFILTPGTQHNPVYLNGTTELEITNPTSVGNVLTVTVNHTFEDADWILATSSADVQDTAGNTSIAGNNVALGGSGNDTIDLSGVGYGLYIDGGTGNDTLTASNSGCILSGRTGADTLLGGSSSDAFQFIQGEGTTALFIDDDHDNTLDSGETFTFSGGVDTVQGFGTGDVVWFETPDNFSYGLSKIDTPADGLVIDQKYFLVQGSLSGSTFTASSGGSDTLVVYDNDPTGVVTTGGLVVKGVTPSGLSCNNNLISKA